MMHSDTAPGPDLKELEALVWEFRERKEKLHEWENNKTTFLGKCRDFSFKLVDELKEKGYPNAKVVCGQYVNFSQDYLDRTDLGFGPVKFTPKPDGVELKVFETPHGFHVGIDKTLLDRKQKLNLGKLARFIEEGFFDTQHCWVVIGDEYIIDVTVDQFHPDDPDPFRVKITDIHHPGFKPYGDGRLEPKPLEFPSTISDAEKIQQLEAKVRELEKEKEDLLLKLCVSTTEMV